MQVASQVSVSWPAWKDHQGFWPVVPLLGVHICWAIFVFSVERHLRNLVIARRWVRCWWLVFCPTGVFVLWLLLMPSPSQRCPRSGLEPDLAIRWSSRMMRFGPLRAPWWRFGLRTRRGFLRFSFLITLLSFVGFSFVLCIFGRCLGSLCPFGRLQCQLFGAFGSVFASLAGLAVLRRMRSEAKVALVAPVGSAVARCHRCLCWRICTPGCPSCSGCTPWDCHPIGSCLRRCTWCVFPWPSCEPMMWHPAFSWMGFHVPESCLPRRPKTCSGPTARLRALRLLSPKTRFPARKLHRQQPMDWPWYSRTPAFRQVCASGVRGTLASCGSPPDRGCPTPPGQTGHVDLWWTPYRTPGARCQWPLTAALPPGTSWSSAPIEGWILVPGFRACSIRPYLHWGRTRWRPHAAADAVHADQKWKNPCRGGSHSWWFGPAPKADLWWVPRLGTGSPQISIYISGTFHPLPPDSTAEFQRQAWDPLPRKVLFSGSVPMKVSRLPEAKAMLPVLRPMFQQLPDGPEERWGVEDTPAETFPLGHLPPVWAFWLCHSHLHLCPSWWSWMTHRRPTVAGWRSRCPWSWWEFLGWP